MALKLSLQFLEDGGVRSLIQEAVFIIIDDAFCSFDYGGRLLAFYAQPFIGFYYSFLPWKEPTPDTGVHLCPGHLGYTLT